MTKRNYWHCRRKMIFRGEKRGKIGIAGEKGEVKGYYRKIKQEKIGIAEEKG